MEIALTPVECCHCGIPFTIPSQYCSSLKETGQRFYCPNGHTLSFGDGENARLKKQTNNQIDTIRSQGEQIESLGRVISNQKGQVTKLKKKLKVK